ncbi:hypothetical protein Tco_1165306 [Tanacetum coccineum]
MPLLFSSLFSCVVAVSVTRFASLFGYLCILALTFLSLRVLRRVGVRRRRRSPLSSPLACLPALCRARARLAYVAGAALVFSPSFPGVLNLPFRWGCGGTSYSSVVPRRLGSCSGLTCYVLGDFLVAPVDCLLRWSSGFPWPSVLCLWGVSRVAPVVNRCFCLFAPVLVLPPARASSVVSLSAFSIAGGRPRRVVAPLDVLGGTVGAFSGSLSRFIVCVRQSVASRCLVLSLLCAWTRAAELLSGARRPLFSAALLRWAVVSVAHAGFRTFCFVGWVSWMVLFFPPTCLDSSQRALRLRAPTLHVIARRVPPRGGLSFAGGLPRCPAGPPRVSVLPVCRLLPWCVQPACDLRAGAGLRAVTAFVLVGWCGRERCLAGVSFLAAGRTARSVAACPPLLVLVRSAWARPLRRGGAGPDRGYAAQLRVPVWGGARRLLRDRGPVSWWLRSPGPVFVRLFCRTAAVGYGLTEGAGARALRDLARLVRTLLPFVLFPPLLARSVPCPRCSGRPSDFCRP